MLKEDSAAAARILVCDWLNLLAGPMIGPGRKYFFNIVVSLLRENRQGRSRVDVDMFLLVYTGFIREAFIKKKNCNKCYNPV